MGCHGNRAFSNSLNWSIYGIFLHSGGPREQLAPILNCPSGARWFKLDPGVAGLRPNQFIYVFILFIRFSLNFLNMQMK